MVHTVGIIGGAANGTYGLERLVAHLQASPLEAPVEVHIFNRNALFGTGDVYDPGQPEYLLLNFSLGYFDMWTGEQPPGVVADALPLHEWCHRRCLPPVPVAKDSYAPRAVAGRYLRHGFEAIAKNLPPGVTLHRHVGEVIDVEPRHRRYRVVYTTDRRDAAEVGVECDKLLLTTGHPCHQPTAEEMGWAEFADRHPGAGFIPRVYPVDRMLAPIPAGARVAVKGMALTFVDAVLTLTEGRGGRFERDAQGKVRYSPSGGEPASILPYSRSGLPALPRASDVTRYTYEPIIFTAEAHDNLKRTSPNGKIDFLSELWPLHEREMKRAYYDVLMGTTAFSPQLRACGNDWRAIRQVIGAFHSHHPDAPRFDCRRLLDPIGDRTFENAAAYRVFAVEYLRREIEKARQGIAANAEKAAVEVWRFTRRVLKTFAAYGGLTPASHRKLHTEIRPRMGRMVFGPPLPSMEKIVALIETGILDLSVSLGPEVAACEETGTFRIRCRRTAAEGSAQYLVDARVRKASLLSDASPLYRNLLRRGLVRVFENSQPGTPPYRPGAIDLAPGECFVVAADGSINPDISVIGVPTEGILYDVTSLSRKKDNVPGVWASHVVAQLRRREH